MVTNGSMEAAALLFRYMVEPGDRVIVEQPSYDRTLLLLGRTGAEIVGGAAGGRRDRHRRLRGGARRRAGEARPRDPELPQPGRLHALRATSASAWSSSPPSTASGSSRTTPTGWSASATRLPPTMLSLDAAERVIHASSFSKTVSPGVRVGYLAGPAEQIATLAKRGSEHYISPNMLAESMVLELCRSGALARQHRVRQRRAARAPRRAGRGAARADSRRPSSSSPRAATSSGSTSPRTSTPRRCSRPPSSEGVAFVAGPDFMLEGGRVEPAALVRERPRRAGRRGRRAARAGARVAARRQRGLSGLNRSRSATCADLFSTKSVEKLLG